MIRVRRLQLGVSLEDLAKRLRCTHQALAFWECAERRLSAAQLLRIARALRTPVAWFYGRAGEMGDRTVLEDYAAAAEAMFLVPEIEALPRLADPQLQAVRAMIRALAPPLAESDGLAHK